MIFPVAVNVPFCILQAIKNRWRPLALFSKTFLACLTIIHGCKRAALRVLFVMVVEVETGYKSK